ncbi:DUF917 domain-containing protein [Brevibacillus humidisoli]|uniref:DUF917 domain-containing protein n=1 Tax=Brevibacillus humidisoli TaxID=2895522 RepID=UPI001E2A94F7|nr:DUF917 domain-containing protein [Brevibacillus humidisoli]UFJ40765.1 DUF917 domain-containing protein [Brevibacillus humidisoli]
MVWTIRKRDIPFFAMGAQFLGSGGGGDPFTMQHLAQSVMSDTQEIVIRSFQELSMEERVVAIGTMGSSAVCDEKMSTGDEGLDVLQRYEEVTGQTVDLIVTENIGGANALIPFIVAAQRNLSILDGDGMGRTFPEIHMTSFHVMGVQGAPLVMVNQHRRFHVLEDEDTLRLSEQARQQVQAMGGIVYTACYGMAGREARTATIPNTMQLIYELGRLFYNRQDLASCLEQMHVCLANSVYGTPRRLIQGKIHSIRRWFVNGSIEGRFEILGTEQWDGQIIEIHFGNEYLAAKRGDQYLCLTPDLLLVLDEENLSPCLVDKLQEGLPVSVFAIPAPNLLRTRDMLQHVGPRAMGIPADYMPTELLAMEANGE